MSDSYAASNQLAPSTNLPTYTGTQARAQELLGDGIQASIVAQTLGVSESYVSQLLADEHFLKGVVERRYEHLAKHNARDSEYDALEDKLLAQLKQWSSMITDPMKLGRLLSIVNAAKRRGQSDPASITQQNVIVNLLMPTKVVDRFQITKNVDNQIIEAGDQKLVTIGSNTLLDRVKAQQKSQYDEVPNGEQQNGITIGRAPSLPNPGSQG